MILRPIYAGYLSILRTSDFRCVFRYYYGVNVNTAFAVYLLPLKQFGPRVGLFVLILIMSPQHIVFGADPVGVRVASFPYQLMDLTKLAYIHF